MSSTIKNVFIFLLYHICIYNIHIRFYNRVRDTCCITIIIVSISSVNGSSLFSSYIYVHPTTAICSAGVTPLPTFVLVILLFLLYPSRLYYHSSCFEYFFFFLCQYIIGPLPPLVLFFYQVIHNYYYCSSIVSVPICRPPAIITTTTITTTLSSMFIFS